MRLFTSRGAARVALLAALALAPAARAAAADAPASAPATLATSAKVEASPAVRGARVGLAVGLNAAMQGGLLSSRRAADVGLGLFVTGALVGSGALAGDLFGPAMNRWQVQLVVAPGKLYAFQVAVAL